MYCVGPRSDTDWQMEKDGVEQGYAIHLKGQMMYMPEWEAIIFLGTPMYVLICKRVMCPT